MINAGVALVPVVAFLVTLWLMDSFRLLKPASVLGGAGLRRAAAAAMLGLHNWLLQATGCRPAC